MATPIQYHPKFGTVKNYDSWYRDSFFSQITLMNANRTLSDISSRLWHEGRIPEGIKWLLKQQIAYIL